jgi:hypothetical protein
VPAGRGIWLLGLAILMAGSACFSPAIPDGAIACGDDGLCPVGFQCGSDGLCRRDATADPDAAVFGCEAADVEADCQVAGTHATLQAAVADDECATIALEEGATYTENVTVGRDLTIEGRCSTIDGGGSGSTLVVEGGATVVVRDLSIVGGLAPEGGGIYNAGTLLLERCRVSENRAEGSPARGGGIHSLGDLELRASFVTLNESVGSDGSSTRALGGGISARDGVLVVGERSRIESNTVSFATNAQAVGGGGGVSSFGAQVRITGQSVVIGNRIVHSGILSDLEGGGVRLVNGATLELDDDSAVEENEIVVLVTGIAPTPTIVGGGISLRNGSAVVTGARVRANRLEATIDSSGEVELLGAGGGGIGGVGEVVLDGVQILDNQVVTAIPDSGFPPHTYASGGGVALSGASTLAVAASSIRGNRVSAGRGGTGAGGGVALFLENGAELQAVFDSCEISDNEASARRSMSRGSALGGGLYAESAGTEASLLVGLFASTVAGNDVGGDLTALTCRGGGLFARTSGGGAQLTAVVENSTVSGNQIGCDEADDRAGGGIFLQAAGRTTAYLLSSTVTGNGAGGGSGGGIELRAEGVATMVRADVANSILFANTADTGPECANSGGTLELNGVLLGSNAGCEFDADGLVPGDPRLGPLAANGGPTRTHALGDASDAVNAGRDSCPNVLGMPLSTDQRGEPRVAGAACDLGAYERQ